MSKTQLFNGSEIAIIGMAGRFPGAPDLRTFWNNLRHGVHSISFFSEEELDVAGVSREMRADPRFVRAGGVLEDADRFDAEFFGFSAREAEIMDPQQRVLLETAWEALESAGYDSERFEGAIGVYAGLAHNTYLYNLLANPAVVKSVGTFQLVIGGEKDFLASRIAYKLNLKGPSVVVQTACSTSLVAVHIACQGLLAGDAQMALAGGGAITFPQTSGYLYNEGGVNSPDGFCRAFDARAQGTVASRGVGMVVLKCLENALADGDYIFAVIKGSAINNDGAHKVGFTAPSVDGQARVVRAAQAVAEVDPATISYIEAHGTGTELGDPIEISALTRAFRTSTDRKQFCAIGSLKSNIGHLDTAAGIAGLIKTTLALEHMQIPPSLHFEQPNPKIDFQETPFYVNSQLAEWPVNGVPRRAAVSSFGIGGTNAHAVLEEAPEREPSESRSHQLLLFSARTPAALESATERLASHLRANPQQDLADIAFTTHVGRRVFPHRRMLACRSHEDAAVALESRDPQRLLTLHRSETEAPVAFLFPGQGTQYLDMAAGLYATEPIFRRCIEECAAVVRPHLEFDLLDVLYPKDGHREGASEKLRQTALAQPAIFIVEYALARLWMEWGVKPHAMIGHSIGEYVAACLAGVMSLKDALSLIVVRGRLMQEMPAGAMLAVPLPEAEASALLHEELSLAAVNGPSMCVLSGSMDAIEKLEAALAERKVNGRRLHTSHAFHSHMMAPMLDRFAHHVRSISLHPPTLPFVSNLTGTWITSAEATSTDYWVRHARDAVRFGDGIATLYEEVIHLFLEVGPGSALSRLAGAHPAKPQKQVLISSMSNPPMSNPARSAEVEAPIEAGAGNKAEAENKDEEVLLGALGRVWLAGGSIDWEAFHGQERRGRVPLPSYPFERRRYWIDAVNAPTPSHVTAPSLPAESSAQSSELPMNGNIPASGMAARHTRPDLPVAYAAARTSQENLLVALWEDLLGIAPVGIHDNFFELGGHSLLATQMATALREKLNVDLPLRKIFDAPTVAAQAAMIAARQEKAGLGTAAGESKVPESSAIPSLTPDIRGRYQPFSMTDVQQAYWIGRSGSFELGQVATHAYVEVEERNLDLVRLGRAWRRLIDRHDMLRAIFLPDGQQQILEHVPEYEIEILDLRDVALEPADFRLQTVRRRMSHQVLPANRWPLFELRASLLANGKTRIHFSFDLLIGDAWSWRILMFELLQFYQDPGLILPPIELSFRDYVLGMAALEETEGYRRSLQYWRDRLETLPPAPDLPLARSLAGIEKPVFKRHEVRLPAEQWRNLKARATRRALTPSGVLLAAFGEVLAVWCRSPRFTINLTLFNRFPMHQDVNRLVGDFTSLTLLAVDCSSPESFEERAQRLQRQLFDDLDHRYVSAVQVLRELARLRPGARTMMPVVFTSTLALEEEPRNGPPRGERVFDDPQAVVYSISQTPQVLLDHQVGEQDGMLIVNWDAVEEAFPAGMLDDLFNAYCHLLRRLADDDEEHAWKQTRRDLLPQWQLERQTEVNATAAPLPSDLLHTAFERQAQERPNEPAVIWSSGSITYGELDRRANRLARHLRGLGARPNRLVAVSIEKGWEQVVAVLAILRAGAAYLPIEPSLPKERRLFLLQHGDVEIVVCRSSAAHDLPPGITPVSVDDASQYSKEDDGALNTVQGPSDLAYVIFTSGSTGLPKGVMIQHLGAINTVVDVNQRYSVGPGDRALALSALNFDLSVYDIFGLLAAGGAIVMPDADKLRDPGHWATLMEQERVTVWNSVPALMQMQADYQQGKGERLPSSLRLVMMSGDWVPTTLPGQIARLSDEVRIFSMGGATEASIWSIDYPILQVDPSWTSIPYGRPMLNQTFYVLNTRLEPCPVWTPGDLFIGGIGLAAGYWKDKEKTDASFITHPGTGERLYRTGDLGRWLPDGNIEFLGREDFQVKVQGHRIELGEIETALLQHPSVKAAVVSAVGERRGNKRLVAYVVPNEGVACEAEDLVAFLREKLPAYMVPSAFVPLASLPLTANGKVDRSGLPSLDHLLVEADQQGFVAARDPLESGLADIWKEVLKVDRVGMHDNFFHLGGHSVLAVRLMAQVERRLGVDLPISALFENPTVERMASLLRIRGGAKKASALVPIQPKGGMPPFFWVHPVGGTVFCYAPLGRALEPEQPLYAFQSPTHLLDVPRSGLNAPDVPNNGVPVPNVPVDVPIGVPMNDRLIQMASSYCRELTAFQPRGPYFLGGWSMGGVIVFEMARQLRAAGHEVAHLTIVDALAPVSGLTGTGSFETLAIFAFAFDLGITLNGLSREDLNVEELIALSPAERFERIFERAKVERIVSEEDRTRVRALFELSEYNRLALAGYSGLERSDPSHSGQSYQGNVLLLQASETVGPLDDPQWGWGRLVEGEVETHVIEGNHFSILTARSASEVVQIIQESVRHLQPASQP
ncbi:MAG TPA: amino acid adenylation domain-containing protein [Candidatus Angelobacter sp.]|nr:amino acid adenylation domain-containing protein [Candidatus Angelobacter sp.]